MTKEYHNLDHQYLTDPDHVRPQNPWFNSFPKNNWAKTEKFMIFGIFQRRYLEDHGVWGDERHRNLTYWYWVCHWEKSLFKKYFPKQKNPRDEYIRSFSKLNFWKSKFSKIKKSNIFGKSEFSKNQSSKKIVLFSKKIYRADFYSGLCL